MDDKFVTMECKKSEHPDRIQYKLLPFFTPAGLQSRRGCYIMEM